MLNNVAKVTQTISGRIRIKTRTDGSCTGYVCSHPCGEKTQVKEGTTGKICLKRLRTTSLPYSQCRFCVQSLKKAVEPRGTSRGGKCVLKISTVYLGSHLFWKEIR